MQADRFTIKSQEALQAAIALAASPHHTETQPEHLMLALLEQPESVVLARAAQAGRPAGTPTSAATLNARARTTAHHHRRRARAPGMFRAS